MLLSDLTNGQIASQATVPVVQKYVLNKFLTQGAGDLFNLLHFEDYGVLTGGNNIAYTTLMYDAPSEAEFRGYGENVDVNNEQGTPVTLYLTNLSKAWQMDAALSLAMSEGERDRYYERQLALSIDAIKIAFAKAFLTGTVDASTGKGVNGMGWYMSQYSGQVVEDMTTSTPLSFDTAIRYEQYINSIAAKVQGDISFIITSREKGLALLQTVASYRNMGIRQENINGANFKMYGNIPIIALPESYFASADVVNGRIPIYMVHSGADEGIKAVIPRFNGGNASVFHIVKPLYTGASPLPDGEGGATAAVFTQCAGIELNYTLDTLPPFAAACGGIVTAPATTYDVIFAADDEIVATVEVPDGGTVPADSIPTVPAKEGYTGVWGDGFDSTTVITEDTLVVAVYTET